MQKGHNRGMEVEQTGKDAPNANLEALTQFEALNCLPLSPRTPCPRGDLSAVSLLQEPKKKWIT
jgi:hypothetical protein